jgi:hypothetical protein
MAQERKIDVIVPVFNVEAYLAMCLTSLVNQTVPVRVIMIDDGSTDNSPAIAQQFATNYPSQIIYRRQKNMGLSTARNKGLELVDAHYVAFMDSDDYVSDDYYEKLLHAAQTHAADVACADITYLYPTGKLVRRPAMADIASAVTCNDDAAYARQMMDIFPMVQNKLWRTDLIKNKFNFLDGRQYEDLDFFYRVYPSTKSIAFTSEGTFYYRQRANSIVKTADSRVLDIIPIFKHILGFYHGHGLYTQYADEIEYLLIRNCLVASAKRLSYARNYRFIREHLAILFDFVVETVPLWRSNPYIQRPTLRHLFIKSFSRRSIGLHAAFLRLFSLFLSK